MNANSAISYQEENTKVLMPSEAFTLLIQCASDVIDNREEGIKSGIIIEGRSEEESVCLLCALNLIAGDYEHRYSPAMFVSLLDKYCLPDMSEYFIDCKGLG